MGKAIGAVAGSAIADRGIRSGVRTGRAGYGQAIESLSAGKQEALRYLQPYTDVGQSALSPLSTLLTGQSYNTETGQFSQVSPEARLSSFYASPDYKFRLGEGMKALEASQAARGGLFSGRSGLEAMRYGQDLASGEYQNYLSNLSALASLGQASSGQAVNIASDVAGQIGQAQIGSAGLGMQGRIARGNLWGQTAQLTGSEIGNAGITAAGGAGGASPALMALFSDERLKQNIKHIGVSPKGINIYEFEYKSEPDVKYQGVIAQELTDSDAVIEKDGFLAVDYSKIDVDFRRL